MMMELSATESNVELDLTGEDNVRIRASVTP